MDDEVIRPFASPLGRNSAAFGRAPPSSALAAFRAEEAQVATAHQGTAFPHEAYGIGAEGVRAPGRIARHAVAEQRQCDLAVADAEKRGIQCAQQELQPAPTLSGEGGAWDLVLAGEGTPDPASHLHAFFE